MTGKNLFMARKIAEKVSKSGGRVFYVGGYVRDKIMMNVNKDIDIEVHGIEPEELAKILASLGEVLTMGASFEVMNLRHYEIDIALPFDIYGGERKAASRRDFTMNALMQDVLTDEILDFFGGINDIETRTIRHVSEKTFLDDPLRVFRAARFAACLDFEIHEDTKNLASCVNLESLANERIMNELALTLLKSSIPSKFFNSLREMHQISCWFEGLEKFSFIDSAAKFRESACEKLYFMMTALCLDANEKFLMRLTHEEKLLKYIYNMKDLLTKDINSFMEAITVFDDAICPEDLILLDRILGRERYTQEIFEIYDSRMKEPYLMGRDLLAAGIKPGPLLGEALKFAHKLRLAGFSKEEQLTQTLEFIAEKINFMIET